MSIGIFPDALGQVTPQYMIWPNLKLMRDLVVVLITCKNEEDPIKNEGASVATKLYVDFSDAQEQIKPYR